MHRSAELQCCFDEPARTDLQVPNLTAWEAPTPMREDCLVGASFSRRVYGFGVLILVELGESGRRQLLPIAILIGTYRK